MRFAMLKYVAFNWITLHRLIEAAVMETCMQPCSAPRTAPVMFYELKS